MVAQDTQQVISDGAELIEDVVELVEDRVSWVSSNPKALAAIVGLTGLAVGGALGYLIASKKLSSRLERKYILQAEKEIEEARQYYNLKHKTGNFATPEEALAQLADGIIAEEGYSSEGDLVETDIINGQEIIVTQTLVEKPVVKAPPIVRNIFEGSDEEDVWDEAEELASRGDDPYVIHHDEYMRLTDNSSGDTINYDQIALTYYEGDNVLTDEREEVIPDSDAVVGDDNLTKFGHGSKDQNIVYVRNDAIDTDFEIIRSTGKYSKEVLGFDDTDELQHSDRRQRRNRSADE